MKTPLAWLNLLHSRARSLVAVAGVAFASVLILMQLGFFTALQISATRVFDQLDFDLALTSPSYRILSRAGTLPLERLTEALSVPEVESTAPMWVGLNGWLNLHGDPPLRRGILIMGIRPGTQAFSLPEVRENEALLAQKGRVLMDRASRPEFGPRDVGVETDVGQSRIKVAGQFFLGADFSADGAAIVGESTFYDLFAWFPRTHCSVGLIRLREGADPDHAAAELQALLPEDVKVRTREQTLQNEEFFWRTKTSVGTIFLLGVVIAMIVGTGIVYQVLSSDISIRLPEFATLKAMGYSASYLTFTVLSQAVILAIGGFIPGLLISYVLYELTEANAHIPMNMSPLVAGFVFVLSLAMCMSSAVLSLRKVSLADPADLF
jgi:putative ABC transport system permease protein